MRPGASFRRIVKIVMRRELAAGDTVVAFPEYERHYCTPLIFCSFGGVSLNTRAIISKLTNSLQNITCGELRRGQISLPHAQQFIPDRRPFQKGIPLRDNTLNQRDSAYSSGRPSIPRNTRGEVEGSSLHPHRRHVIFTIRVQAPVRPLIFPTVERSPVQWCAAS